MIPFEFAGVASGNISRGLRPLGSPKITLRGAAAYRQSCEKQGIVLDIAERKAAIREQIDALAKEVNGIVPIDDALLAEVANLVEAPIAFLGTFDAEYLELPRDVLVTVMRKHQRYFAIEDADGQLMNYFIGVRNGDSEHLDKVIHGNEQVLRARFSDARFFYQADIKQKLADHLPRLETLTFQAELGSMREKNDRVAATIGDLGELLGFAAPDIEIASEAARIAKADLATSMVVEMTSLQGIMGREYALREGIAPEVAVAIREHWLPSGAGDKLPETDAGRLLALADKLDSLVGLIAVGLAPKSTSDPFGLRRAALGVIRILVEAGISADLRPLITRVAASQPLPVDSARQQQALDFVKGRLENWLGENLAVPRDVINAVLKQQAHSPYRAVNGIEELARWVKRDNWEELLDSFARCVRITRAESAAQVCQNLLIEPEERVLFASYSIASNQLSDSTNVDGFLSAFEAMAPAVTDFFDNVLVHADDVGLRNNRIALLQCISKMQEGRADLSELDNF